MWGVDIHVVDVVGFLCIVVLVERDGLGNKLNSTLFGMR